MTTAPTPTSYYARHSSEWHASREFVESALKSLLEPAVPTIEVSTRVKELPSFIAKIHNGATPRTPESIRDAVGARVICASVRDGEKVLEVLDASEFRVWDIDRKHPGAEELGYAGIHCFINGADLMSAPPGIVDVELQIRTRAQDAWSVLSHSALYKPPGTPMQEDTSVAFKRRINRLSALVEIFDDEVEAVLTMRINEAALKPLVSAEGIGRLYDKLLGDSPRTHSPSTTMCELLGAYPPEDDPVSLVDRYIAEHDLLLREIVRDHDPNGANYTDNIDWLLLLPEALVVAERSANARHRLAAVAVNTAYEYAVRSVASYWGHPLPTA